MVVCGLASHDVDPGDGYARSVSADEFRRLDYDWPPYMINAIE